MRQNADKTAVDFIMIKVVILSTSLDIESLRQYRNIDRSQCQVCRKPCIDRIASRQAASIKVLYNPLKAKEEGRPPLRCFGRSGAFATGETGFEPAASCSQTDL